MKIEEFYEQVRKNRDLPSFEEMDSLFDISSIENPSAKKIAEKIIEKLEKFRNVMEEFLQSDGSSIAVLFEIKEMDEKDKEKINSLYKELMLLERDFLLCELDNGDFPEFVEKSLKKWSQIKPNLKEIIIKAKDSWKKDTKVQEELGYLG